MTAVPSSWPSLRILGKGTPKDPWLIQTTLPNGSFRVKQTNKQRLEEVPSLDFHKGVKRFLRNI